MDESTIRKTASGDSPGTRIRVRRIVVIALLAGMALAAASCSSDSPESEATSGARALSGTFDGENSDGASASSGDDEQPSPDGSDQPVDEVELDRPIDAIDREEIVVVDDDIVLPEPAPELVEEAVVLEDVIEERGVETPCDLYPDADLRTQMAAWSEGAGLTADLPAGLLGSGSEIEFDVGVQSPTNCSWFSEAQLWSVEISFQPVSGFTDELQSRGELVSGIGDSASINDDTSGSVTIGDLFVSVTNLAPGHTQTSNDRAVLVSMLTDVATKLA